ncbi:amidase [Setomelanomma holmii]|uniref:Amidase n=1 Tax=Setomelanomma holmii TaxID=210430 RepID=A0A9P4LN39_9PLEO|nr:amidase [Setomelanomma holmii]
MDSAPPITNSVAAKIPKDWLLPTSLTSQYTETSTISVLDSVEVVTAFCKRAAIAQQCVSCLTETMFDSALARAAECDAYLAREGKPIGPLHGLPISLKDSFNVKGVQATIGYVSFIAHPPAPANSAVVDILLQQGAVLYVKTNLPQAMMTADSHNNIFGRTLNPLRLDRTAGGSTGGEAALLAMKGSVLGVSTDIAGSNRIPALCCGIKSIKPTASRVPFAGGVPVGRLGSPSAILPVIGPCGRSVRDFQLFLKSVVGKRAWGVDADALNVPWRGISPFSRPLRFGLLRGCKERPLHPPIARGMHHTATKLKEVGHTIVLLDDKVPDLYQSALLAWKFFLLDPNRTPLKHIQASCEPVVPSLPTCSFPELAEWKPNLDELWNINVQRAEMVKAWKDNMVQENLDAVLMPGYQAPAPKHDTYGVPIYTVVPNLINYPACILSTGFAEKEEDGTFLKDVKYEPAYEPDEVEGLPCHVQILGKPMEDEELLQIMKVVEETLGKK